MDADVVVCAPFVALPNGRGNGAGGVSPDLDPRNPAEGRFQAFRDALTLHRFVGAAPGVQVLRLIGGTDIEFHERSFPNVG